MPQKNFLLISITCLKAFEKEGRRIFGIAVETVFQKILRSEIRSRRMESCANRERGAEIVPRHPAAAWYYY
jgi:hypothetical protein